MKPIRILLSAILSASATAAQSCPNVKVFGARETTAPPGFGSASTVVNLIEQANSGATSESIVYPAAGGNVYAASVTAGVAAVANQTKTFNQMCPESKIVMVGYSQGAQIVDDAFCGGPDGTSLNTTAASISLGVGKMVAAIILMGNPRHVNGLPFNVGNATAGGFAARPVGFQCLAFEDIIAAFCDVDDPFCAKGNSSATHQGYGSVYGQAALAFVQSKLDVSQRTSSNGTGFVSTSEVPTLHLNWGLLLAFGGLVLL
ncbi:carbohydrate esterase family 5 protein [Hypoxylon rubiginosum]|uniref:Carbohydrate esterase family 5 protein n=1 Tax=Hypoxylon rubiginosum TaxID=110542 RepID=A0ACB9YZA3_9PEZI|nr:carbohydrate esterase family 5 protein [Hypoxylon rubiginosum]